MCQTNEALLHRSYNARVPFVVFFYLPLLSFCFVYFYLSTTGLLGKCVCLFVCVCEMKDFSLFLVLFCFFFFRQMLVRNFCFVLFVYLFCDPFQNCFHNAIFLVAFHLSDKIFLIQVLKNQIKEYFFNIFLLSFALLFIRLFDDFSSLSSGCVCLLVWQMFVFCFSSQIPMFLNYFFSCKNVSEATTI